MSSEKTMIRDLTKGNVLPQLLRFAAPLLLANILQMVYNVVDMVVIGRFVGSAGISAVSNGGDLLLLFTTFSMGFTNAGQVIIAQFVGKNDKKSINSMIGTMMTFILALSIVLMVVGLSASKWLLTVLNTPTDAYEMAVDYTAVCFAGLFFIFGYNIVSAILRGMGDAKRPFVFIGIATVVNIILDLVFVAGLGMRAKGAALATVIGQGVSFIFSLIYLYRHREAFGFDFAPKSFKINKQLLAALTKLGLPMALQHVAVSLSGLVVAALINSHGLVASAVAGIGGKLRLLIQIFASSIGTAASSMIGQNFGAGLYDRVKNIYRCSFRVLIIICAILGGLCLMFPEAVFGIFDTNPEVLAMAPQYMVINFVTFIAFAFMQPGIALVNGIGYAKLSFIVGMMDGVVCRIFLVLLLGLVLKLGVWGIWWGAVLPAFVNGAITMGYYLSGRWRNRKPIIS